MNCIDLTSDDVSMHDKIPKTANILSDTSYSDFYILNTKQLPLDIHHYIGRRTVLGYALGKGTAYRSYSIKIDIEPQKDPKSTSNNLTKTNSFNTDKSKLNFKTNFSFQKKKDKFAELLFHLEPKFYADSTYSIETIRNAVGKSCSGRLPGLLCDFLVPLLKEKFIHVCGHVAYDIGCCYFNFILR